MSKRVSSSANSQTCQMFQIRLTADRDYRVQIFLRRANLKLSEKKITQITFFRSGWSVKSRGISTLYIVLILPTRVRGWSKEYSSRPKTFKKRGSTSHCGTASELQVPPGCGVGRWNDSEPGRGPDNQGAPGPGTGPGPRVRVQLEE